MDLMKHSGKFSVLVVALVVRRLNEFVRCMFLLEILFNLKLLMAWSLGDKSI